MRKPLINPGAAPICALAAAGEVHADAAAYGFDWPDIRGVRAKVTEELAELDEAFAGHGDIEDELGDLLFTLVNLARHAGIDPSKALLRTNAKFAHRFEHVKRRAAEAGITEPSAQLDALEAFWQEAKRG